MAPDSHRNALKPGYMVHWYRIEKILGQGGFGITYLAEDTNLHQPVAVKEYLPVEVAVRDGDFSVHPVSENHSDSFHWGLERFVAEARTLARFDHPNIVRVLSVFEMNNTAYMVMRYEKGSGLQQMLSKRETIDESRLESMLFPVLDGLERVHAAGFIHRDIKPGNIYIRHDGTPVLLDFGSARRSLGEATRTLTTLVSPGYAPFEQYFSKSDRQGPWTDIYGLGATFYRAVVGVPPMNAVDRSEGILKQGRDPLLSAAQAAAGRYSPHFLEAIDWSLRFDESARPQSIAEWRQAFTHGVPEVTARAFSHAGPVTATTVSAAGNVDVLLEATAAAAPARSAPPRRRRKRKRYLVAGIAAALLLLLTVNANKSGRTRNDLVARPAQPVAAAPAEAITPTGGPAPPATQTASIAPSPAISVDRLLRSARADIDAGRLSTPPGDNALEKFRRVLALDPGNPAARDGIREIVETYAELGKQAAERRDYDRASFYIRQARAIAPNSKPLKKAEERLEKIRRRDR